MVGSGSDDPYVLSMIKIIFRISTRVVKGHKYIIGKGCIDRDVQLTWGRR